MLARFVLRRLLAALPTLMAVATLSFVMMHAAPGSPFSGGKMTPLVAAQMRARFGLDRPLPEQYLRYLGGVIRGDFGPSLKYPGLSVGDIIAQGWPTSATLGLAAFVTGASLGLAIGVAAAVSGADWTGRVASVIEFTGVAVPAFTLGPLLVLVFAAWLGWLPGGGLESARGYVLPVAVLAVPLAAAVSRIVRAGLRDALVSDAVRTARARGLSPRRVVLSYALPLALLPVVSILAPALAGLMTGSFVVEQVFGIAGIGRAFVMGAIQRDYTLVMGVVLLYSALILLLNLVADLLYRAIDPRVSLA